MHCCCCSLECATLRSVFWIPFITFYRHSRVKLESDLLIANHSSAVTFLCTLLLTNHRSCAVHSHGSKALTDTSFNSITVIPRLIATCSWSLAEMKETFVGYKATASGWGTLKEDGKPSCILQEVEVPVISNERCVSETNYTNKMITSNMLCAGYPGKGERDSCQGDSGGPLVIERADKRLSLIGVVSWGNGCARKDFPGVYTRVTRFMTWILANTADGCYCKEWGGVNVGEVVDDETGGIVGNNRLDCRVVANKILFSQSTRTTNLDTFLPNYSGRLSPLHPQMSLFNWWINYWVSCSQFPHYHPACVSRQSSSELFHNLALIERQSTGGCYYTPLSRPLNCSVLFQSSNPKGGCWWSL